MPNIAASAWDEKEPPHSGRFRARPRQLSTELLPGRTHGWLGSLARSRHGKSRSPHERSDMRAYQFSRRTWIPLRSSGLLADCDSQMKNASSYALRLCYIAWPGTLATCPSVERKKSRLLNGARHGAI